MKRETLYNHADNLLYVKSHGDNICIICNDMDQIDSVQKKMHKHGNIMAEVEEWDGDEDRKYIVTFRIGNGRKPVYN